MLIAVCCGRDTVGSSTVEGVDDNEIRPQAADNI